MLPSPPNGLSIAPSSSASSSPTSPRHAASSVAPPFRLPLPSLFGVPPSSLRTHPTTEETADSHNRQKLDFIRSSLQQYEQKWEEEEAGGGEENENGGENGAEYWEAMMDEEEEEEDEEDEEEEEDWAEHGWRANMVQNVVQAGYDRESAYYALKLVNFRSVSEAVEVLASVKQKLVKQQQNQQQLNHPKKVLQSNALAQLTSSRSLVFVNEPSELIQPESMPKRSAGQHSPAKVEHSLLPPADPFPRSVYNENAASSTPFGQRKTEKAPAAQLSEWQSPPLFEQSPRKTLLGNANALRQSKSFGPADVFAAHSVSSAERSSIAVNGRRHIPPQGTAARIERNQSERTERKSDKRRETELRKGIATAEKKAHCVTAFPVCAPSSSQMHQNGPQLVQRIFVDPQMPLRRVANSPPNYSQFISNKQFAASSPISSRQNSVANRCVSPLPESIAKKLKNNTYDRAVKPCRAPMFRFFMEQHIEKLTQQFKERNQREMQLTREMELAKLAEPVKTRMLRLLRQKESKYIRLRRQKMNRDMFELIRHIGIGAFGKVTLVRKKDSDNQVYAMKTLIKADVIQKQQAAHVKAERDILSEANSPWIVKLFFSFQDVENLYFIMEYVPGGDMMQLLINMGIFPESLARFYIAELTLAVEYVHSLGFIHRDIKPDNILIDRSGHIKLTDFGLCTGLRWTHDKRHYVVYDEQSNGGLISGHVRDDSFSLPQGLDQRVKVLEMRHHRKRDRAHSVVGTGNYMAPEVVQKIGHTQLCDWWSVGVILYEMVYGRPPFMSQRDDPAETQFMIVHWRRFLDLRNAMGVRLSKQCADCVAKLCCDQENRLGHRNGAKDIKAHQWFKGIDFANLRNTMPEYVPRVQHPEDTSNFDTFEVENEEMIRETENGNENRFKCGAYGGGAKPLAPNFIDFTFRHFFSEGMCPPARGRSPQVRPSLAPLMESSAEGSAVAKVPAAGAKPTKTTIQFLSSKRMPAPPIPSSSSSVATTVQIGGNAREGVNPKQ